MAVRIRLKKMGRKARPFFRLCAVDSRAPRDGKVIEELGYYDPMVRETDARAVLKGERIDYWLGVGAQPTEKAGVLIKKYGSAGTHVQKQQAALERMKSQVVRPEVAQPAAEVAAPAAEVAKPAAEVAKPAAEVAAPAEAPLAETPAQATPAEENTAEKTAE